MDANRFRRKKIDDKAWVDWLSDEPPAAGVQQEVRQKRMRRANEYRPRSAQPTTKSADEPAPAVSIQINLPAFDKEKFRRRKRLLFARLKRVQRKLLRHRKWLIIGSTAVLVLIVGSSITEVVRHNHRRTEALKVAHRAGQNLTRVATKPSFMPAVPVGKDYLATPDGKQSRYDGTHDTYSFADTLEGDHITVSEQPAPKKFASGQDAVDSIAALSFKSAKRVSVGVTTAYIASFDKSEAQTAITTVNGLLVFVQSSAAHTASIWATYLATLN